MRVCSVLATINFLFVVSFQFQELNLSDVGQYFLIWGFEYVQNIFHSAYVVIVNEANGTCSRNTFLDRLFRNNRIQVSIISLLSL